MKCLSRDRLENGTQEFLKEAGLMQTIDHENIVRMYGVVLDKENSLMLVNTNLKLFTVLFLNLCIISNFLIKNTHTHTHMHFFCITNDSFTVCTNLF